MKLLNGPIVAAAIVVVTAAPIVAVTAAVAAFSAFTAMHVNAIMTIF